MDAAENLSHYVIIPAYNPDKSLLELVESLSARAITEIIVVNDGSDEAHRVVFRAIQETYPHIILIHLEDNRGKGAALKIGFQYVIDHCRFASGVITMDADGQHHPDDLVRVVRRMQDSRDALVIGVRSFNRKIPLRSKLGNILTRLVFWLFTGQKLRDTQSGLRGIPILFLKKLTTSRCNRYDFELDMLLMAHRQGTRLEQIPIQTIYIDQNQSSHFRPVMDSIKVYLVFVKYLLVGLLSFGIDYGLFLIMINLFALPPWMCHVVVRFFSAAANFLMNRFWVFKSRGHIGLEYIKYILTAAYVLVFSTSLLYLLHDVAGLVSALAKPLADGMTFLLSFLILSIWVFRR